MHVGIPTSQEVVMIPLLEAVVTPSAIPLRHWLVSSLHSCQSRTATVVNVFFSSSARRLLLRVLVLQVRDIVEPAMKPGDSTLQLLGTLTPLIR